MANPMSFSEQTMVWAASEGDAGDLPAHHSEGVNISKWRLSWRERLRAFLTGAIWLHVHQRQQPPVYVSAEYPFERGAAEDDA